MGTAKAAAAVAVAATVAVTATMVAPSAFSLEKCGTLCRGAIIMQLLSM